MLLFGLGVGFVTSLRKWWGSDPGNRDEGESLFYNLSRKGLPWSEVVFAVQGNRQCKCYRHHNLPPHTRSHVISKSQLEWQSIARSRRTQFLSRSSFAKEARNPQTMFLLSVQLCAGFVRVRTGESLAVLVVLLCFLEERNKKARTRRCCFVDWESERDNM